MSENLAVIIHGGAGKIGTEHAQKKLPPLKQALEAAWQSLAKGDDGELAVVEALRILEGSEYFNAGYGGYPNINGIVLTDVSLMRGNREFVSLIHCRKIKYPSVVALDMLNSGQTILSTWTHELMTKLETGPDHLKDRYGLVNSHDEMIAPFVKEMIAKKQELEVANKNSRSQQEEENGTEQKEQKHGTVGCVVRDSKGRISAGTSTGGVSFKSNGRIGDTPIVGSGVYADNEICGLSTTGHGESFLRTSLSSFVMAEMRHALREDPFVFAKDPKKLKALLDKEFAEMERKVYGHGAIIVIPPQGDPCYAFNADRVSLAYRYGDVNNIRADDVLVDSADGAVLR